MRRAILLGLGCLTVLAAGPGCGADHGVGGVGSAGAATGIGGRMAQQRNTADHWTGANADLAEAARRGDADAARAAIRAGGDVHAVSAHGMPMVLWPVLTGSFEGYVALLDAGADPAAPFDEDAVATEMMVGLDDQRFLNEALARGADPNAVGSNAEPLVWKAHFADRWDVIQTLVESGADADAPNHGEPGATLLANYSRGLYDRALWLLRRGADPTHRIEVAPPGYEDRVGAMPILENIHYYEVDEAAFPEIADRQREVQAFVREQGYPVPPRPRRYAPR